MRRMVPACCEWHDGTYPWQALVNPCGQACRDTIVRLAIGPYAILKEWGGGYLQKHQVAVPSLVVERPPGVVGWVRGGEVELPPWTYGPAWLPKFFALGTALRQLRTGALRVDWPAFLGRCHADPELREAVRVAAEFNIVSTQLRKLILSAVPEVAVPRDTRVAGYERIKARNARRAR